MTTQVERGRKILAYDGDCPMCLAIVTSLVRAGLIESDQARSNHDLPAADLSAVEAAGIRNQLVVLDPATRETRAGVDALLWIIAKNRGNPWWVRLLALPGIRHLLIVAYRVISYNRRVISPPRNRVRCDCEPEVTLARRLSLVVPLIAFTVPLTGVFGAAVFRAASVGDLVGGALWMTSALGLGWIAMVAAAVFALRGEQRIDYLAHLAVTAFVGALVLLPAGIMAWWLPREMSLALAVLSVAASFAVMFRMQQKRMPFVGLSTRWLWSWAAALVTSVAGSMLIWRAIA